MADVGAELLARSESEVRLGLVHAVAYARAARPREELALDLARGQLPAAMLRVSGDLDRGLRTYVLPALLTAFIRGGDHVVAQFGRPAFAFDPMQSAAAYNSLADRWVQTIVGDQDLALDAAARASLAGETSAGSAALVAAIGMTPARVGYLDAYRRSLRGIDPPLTIRRQRELVDNHGTTLLATRIEGLSLTLAQQALHLGQDEAVGQARRVAVIDDDDVVWEWITRDDSHVRPTHRPMHGQRRLDGEPFMSGAGVPLAHPHDPAAPLSETAGCRCGLRLLV